MARLYSNENFPFPVVTRLRELGHDVVTIQERGRAGEALSDLEVLKAAVSEDRAILTLNRRDFIRLHQDSPNHAGIIVCTVDRNSDRQARQIHREISKMPSLRGKLVRINKPA